MIKQLMAFSLLISSFTVLASSNYYPQEFEAKIHSQKDANLKSYLFSVLTSGHVKNGNAPDSLIANCTTSQNCYAQVIAGYGGARKLLFGKIDLKKDERGYFIKDVYCDREMRTADVAPNQIPRTGTVNCEHTWPQSRFSSAFPAEMQKSDMHHLYATNAQANSTRGNNPFGEVMQGEQAAPNCNASQIGKATSGNGGLYFEPPAFHKGNVARSLFYFSIRYQLPIDKIQEAYLRQWHKEDPVDQAEMQRNDSIYLEQKNRNPFVDYPELVEEIADF